MLESVFNPVILTVQTRSTSLIRLFNRSKSFKSTARMANLLWTLDDINGTGKLEKKRGITQIGIGSKLLCTCLRKMVRPDIRSRLVSLWENDCSVLWIIVLWIWLRISFLERIMLTRDERRFRPCTNRFVSSQQLSFLLRLFQQCLEYGGVFVRLDKRDISMGRCWMKMRIYEQRWFVVVVCLHLIHLWLISLITHVLDFWLKPPVTAGWLKNRRSKSVFRFTPLFLLIFLPFPYEISWKCSSLSKELVYNVLEHVLQKSLKLIVIGSNTTNDYFL